jgi:hypothetical protein
MSTNATFKIFTDKMGGTRANNYIGNTGEVFYDIDGTTPLRLSDGVTPGGIPFGIASVSSSYNPQFKTVSGNTLSGTVSTGSYVKQGAIVHFRVNVDFANTTDFGAASQYKLTLPFPAAATVTIRGGTLHSKPANPANNAIYHIAGITDIEEPASSNTEMLLYYSGSTTDLAWKSTTPVGATSNVSHFDISGAYETSSLFVSI